MKEILNIYKVILFAGLLLFAYSCDDELDINPEDNLRSSDVFTSETAVRGAVTGLYGQARHNNALNGNRYAFTGLQADELTFVGSFITLTDVFNYQTQAVNGNTSEFWDEGFEIVNLANFIITFVPDLDIANFTDAEKSVAVAEAKFMRATMNFEMLRVYAQPFQVNGGNSLGIPLSTQPFTDDTDPADFNIGRSTVNEVQTAIRNDLEDAIADLPNSTSTNNTRASKGAAQALLARLHLYREEWSQAANLANEVINNPAYAIASDYSFYGTTNNESVFVLANTETDGAFGGTGLTAFANPRSTGGRGDLFYSDFLLNAYNSGSIAPSNTEGMDLRLVQTTAVGSDVNGNSQTFQGKVSSSGADPLPIIRIAEMYLIRAEANLRGNLSVGDTPLNDVNRIRSRAGLTNLTSVTLDDIMTERLKEFANEGHRRMDLLRNRLPLRQSGDPRFTEAAFGADKTIFPIPSGQLNVNPALSDQQNPGY